jgi:DNA helicase MCM8
MPSLVFWQLKSVHFGVREDAEEVVEIMRDTMIDVFHDGLGHLDFTRSANGSGMSSRGISKRFLAALERASRMQQRNVFFVNELKQVRIKQII